MALPHRPSRRKRTLCQLTAVFAALLLFAASGRFYTVTDGSRTVRCFSFRREPERILSRAGFAYTDADRIERSGDTLILRRAARIRLTHHGKTRTLLCRDETVGQLLDRLELTPMEGDILSHSPEDPVTAGMDLRIDRIVTRQEEYAASVAHGVRVCTDPTLPRDTEQVLIPGRDGQVLRTASVTYRNGAELRREILREDLIRPPVTEVVARGTGEAAPAPAEAGLTIGDGYIRLATGEVLTYTRTDTVLATGYTHTDEGCDTVTATGTTVHRGTVAVDPRFIPYGTRMFIVAGDGSFTYGIATAEDCGGAIKRDRMDLYFPTYAECIRFGKRRCTVYFLGDPSAEN